MPFLSLYLSYSSVLQVLYKFSYVGSPVSFKSFFLSLIAVSFISFITLFPCNRVRVVSFPDPRTHAVSLCSISYSIILSFDHLFVDTLSQVEEVMSFLKDFNQEWALNFVKSRFWINQDDQMSFVFWNAIRIHTHTHKHTPKSFILDSYCSEQLFIPWFCAKICWLSGKEELEK